MTSASTNNDPVHTDVAVIGGGIAGLTAAATAARAGARVVIFESRGWGGRARSTERDGFVLNEGGHALYHQAGGKAVLDRLGVRLTGGPAPTEHAATIWDGEIVALPISSKAVLSTPLLGTRSKIKLGALYPRLAGIAGTLGDVSLAEWFDHERVQPDLRKYLTTLLRLSTYSAEPEPQLARLMLRQLAAGGVLYVDGGWQSLVGELRRVTHNAGVTMHDHAPVTELVADAGAWTLATPALSVRAAAVVFAAGGPALAIGLIGDDPAAWLENAGPVTRAACLDIGCAPGAHRFLLSSDEPMYLSEHAPTARLAPAHLALYSLMQYLPAGTRLDSERSRTALERHAARAGLPTSGERQLERFLAAPVVSWGSPLAGLRRPTGLELADRGLLAAGDWVGEHLLADASITSGERAGQAAARSAMVTR